MVFTSSSQIQLRFHAVPSRQSWIKPLTANSNFVTKTLGLWLFRRLIFHERQRFVGLDAGAVIEGFETA